MVFTPITRLSRRHQGFKSPWGRHNKINGLANIAKPFSFVKSLIPHTIPHKL
jgi:hypothetical protein